MGRRFDLVLQMTSLDIWNSGMVQDLGFGDELRYLIYL